MTKDIYPFNCKSCGKLIKKIHSNIPKAHLHKKCTKKCKRILKDNGGYPLNPILRTEYIKTKKKILMTQEEKNLFYSTQQWQTLRFEAFLKYGRHCLVCGARPPQVILHVDHIKPISKYPELKLDINNLQVLCASCNRGKLNIYETDFRY